MLFLSLSLSLSSPQTVDNSSLNNGKYLLSEFILQNGSIRLAFSDILNECGGGNATVFQALKLNQSSYFQDILNFSNISQVRVGGCTGTAAVNFKIFKWLNPIAFLLYMVVLKAKL